MVFGSIIELSILGERCGIHWWARSTLAEDSPSAIRSLCEPLIEVRQCGRTPLLDEPGWSAASDRGRVKTRATRNFRGHRSPPTMPIVDPGPFWKVDLAFDHGMTEFSHNRDPYQSLDTLRSCPTTSPDPSRSASTKLPFAAYGRSATSGKLL